MQQMIDRLSAVYRELILPRMQDLPVYNPHLSVETRGFMSRDNHFSGILFTPWCMNLVLLPADGADWEHLPPGSAVEIDFPAGTQRMVLSLTEDIPAHLSLPLFTTVEGFSDQDMAREVADEILLRLYRPGDVQESPDRPRMSRRDLLRGRLGASTMRGG